MNSCFKIYILLFIVTAKCTSQIDVSEVQTFLDSSSTRDFFSNYFTNDRLSSNLISKFSYTLTKDKLEVFLKNYYSSNVSKLTTKLFRDYDNVVIGTGYYLKDNFKASLNYSGQLYSDEKNVKGQGTFSNYIYASGIFQDDFKGVSYYSRINTGYKIERQIEELNKGFSTNAEFKVTNLNINDYFFDGQLKLKYEDLNPRRNTIVYVKTYLDKSFTDGLARNELDASFSRIRKEFYFPADQTTINQFGIANNIENRIEYVAKGYDRFDYTISERVGFYLTVEPYYRNIFKENLYVPNSTSVSPSVYDTRVFEFMLGGEAALTYDYKKLNTQFRMKYSERDEQHTLINEYRIPFVFVRDKQNLEASKNNHSSTVRMTGSVNYDLTLKNRFEVSAMASLLKYDTQSNLNFDDRDELNYLFYIAHRYNNLQNLNLLTSVDLNLYHTVYIFAQKSSNNNWNRVIRLQSRSIFEPSKSLRSINTFSVLANYTAYDFEDLLSSVKSYSFRQFNAKDSTQWFITENLAADIYGEIKLYERGELNWRAFTLRPVTYYEDKIVNGYLSWFFSRRFFISAGYRFFEQKRFNYLNGDRIFDTFVRTLGPVAKFKAEFNSVSYIEVIGSYDFYRFPDESVNSSNGNIIINVMWNF